MLRIAIQSKGRLYDDTMNLLAEADIKVALQQAHAAGTIDQFPLGGTLSS